MNNQVARLLSLFLALLFTAPIYPQTSAPGDRAVQPGADHSTQQQAQAAIVLDPAEGRIKLDVVVTDSSGSPVYGLERSDFTLRDNKQQQKIVSFAAFDETTAKPSPQAEAVILMDTIDKSARESYDVKDQVEKFLRRNGGHLDQLTTVYLLSDSGLSVTPQPSTDGNLLASQVSHTYKLREVPMDNGENAYTPSVMSYHDARLSSVVRHVSAANALASIILEQRRRPGRKLLVWVGYSGHVKDASFDWITEISTRLREARITLFSVMFWKNPRQRLPYETFLPGVKSATEAAPGNMTMEVLAVQSGGHLEQTMDNNLERNIATCLVHPNSYYTLSFDPPPTQQTDEYHDITVEVDKPGLSAATRSGYYNQPSFYDQPHIADERVTVSELDQLLTKIQGSPDAEIAARLSRIVLTERMSSARLSAWQARLPRGRAWAVFVTVADASVFLKPPHAEIVDAAAPSLAAQRQMLSLTLEYLQKTIHKLPELFATRITTRYREAVPKPGETWKTALPDRTLHFTVSSHTSVLYRNGYEVVETEKKKKDKEEGTLDTKGTFGPVLIAVTLDATTNDLAWDRWEQGPGGRVAVYRYTVPRAKSHYELSYRAILDDGVTAANFQLRIGYHGEVAIDPESGAILRLTLEADKPRTPLLRSSIMVEYAPVDIGGRSCTCLVRSVTIARGRTIFEMREWGSAFLVYGPFQTMLDEVAFTNYHMFHGESRILPGYNPLPESPENAPPSAGPKP